MSSLEPRSGTASSPPSKRLLHLSFSKINSGGPPITPAPASSQTDMTLKGHQEPSVVWGGPSTTSPRRKPFGLMSTAEKASLTRHSWTGPIMLQLSSAQLVSQRRYTLARVTVCISIGRLTWRWILRRGEDMRPGSLHFLRVTGFRSTLLALRIYRRYSEPPEHTTASRK